MVRVLKMENDNYKVIEYESIINNKSLTKNFCNSNNMASSDIEKKRLVLLKNKLLEYGGLKVAIPSSEDDAYALLKRGIHKVSNVKNTKKISGKRGASHANVSEWWIHNKERITIMTGYALSEKGVWVQHSWCYDNKLKIMLETCQRKTNYFGIVLSFQESYEFYLANSK